MLIHYGPKCSHEAQIVLACKSGCTSAPFLITLTMAHSAAQQSDIFVLRKAKEAQWLSVALEVLATKAAVSSRHGNASS